RITSLASFTAAAMSSYTRSQKPILSARRRTSAPASKPAISLASLPRRVAWAMDEPIRPKPMMASLLKASILGRHELLQQRDRQPVLLFGAHRHAQAIGQAIAGDRTQDDAAPVEEGV